MIDIFSRAAICANHPDDPDAMPALALARRAPVESLIEGVRQSGLNGKGGAGFPTFRKIAAIRKQPGREKFVVINGGEHEPGSLKDRWLLDTHPYTVIEGALILARLAGASKVWIGVSEGANGPAKALRSAVAAMMAAGESSSDGPRARLAVETIEDSYLVGEESALLAALEGRPGLPTRRPPFPFESGLRGAPTLVQNVETAAHLPFIIANGADRYRMLSPHGMAVTLCTFGPEFANSGVRLVPLGISLREVIHEYGGGLKGGRRVKAVQPGGPASGFLTAAQFDLPFHDAALKQVGSALGCAVIRAFSDDEDMVGVVAGIMDFFARNCCGQCPPCRMETQMLSNIMKQTLAGRGTDKLLEQVPAILNASAHKGICGLIKMPAAPILSALSHFPDEFERHVAVFQAS